MAGYHYILQVLGTKVCFTWNTSQPETLLSSFPDSSSFFSYFIVFISSLSLSLPFFLFPLFFVNHPAGLYLLNTMKAAKPPDRFKALLELYYSSYNCCICWHVLYFLASIILFVWYCGSANFSASFLLWKFLVIFLM